MVYHCLLYYNCAWVHVFSLDHHVQYILYIYEGGYVGDVTVSLVLVYTCVGNILSLLVCCIMIVCACAS